VFQTDDLIDTTRRVAEDTCGLCCWGGGTHAMDTPACSAYHALFASSIAAIMACGMHEPDDFAHTACACCDATPDVGQDTVWWGAYDTWSCMCAHIVSLVADGVRHG
jgi:hypothetical protein